MTKLPSFLIKVYSCLLRLFPPSFRAEFEEQMLQDFSDLMNDAHREGRYPLLQFCVRESLNFPVNLLRIHLRENALFKKIHSEPFHHMVGGAIGFGLGFAFLSLVQWWIGGMLFELLDPFVEDLSAWTGGFIKNDVLPLVPFLVQFIAYVIVTSTGFGGLIACFLGNHLNFSRYVIAGALCWFIPEFLTYVLIFSLGVEYYRNEPFTSILGYSMLVLMGAFFSAAPIIGERPQKQSLLRLSAAVVIYPLLTCFFIELLSQTWYQVTSEIFIALIAFVIVLTVGVIAIAMPDSPKQVLGILAGALGYFLLNRAVFYIAYYTPGYSVVSEIGIVPDVLIVPVYHMGVYKGILGVLFGFLLGWILGMQKENHSQPVAA